MPENINAAGQLRSSISSTGRGHFSAELKAANLKSSGTTAKRPHSAYSPGLDDAFCSLSEAEIEKHRPPKGRTNDGSNSNSLAMAYQVCVKTQERLSTFTTDLGGTPRQL